MNTPVTPGPTIERRVEDLARSRPALPFDPLLALATLGILVCSIVVIHSATQDDVAGSPNYYVIRQAGYAIVGLMLALVVSRVDYSRLRELKYGIYGAMIGLILLVIAAGSTARGSRRSFDLAFLGSFQPSEFGKLLLTIALAAFVVDRVRRLQERRTTTQIVMLGIGPALLVMAQPDLGSGLVYLAITATLLFIAGAPGRHFAVLGTLAVLAAVFTLGVAPAAGVAVLKPYQVDRLTAFLNPSDNPSTEGYQQNQSRIAIGSGQKTGRGVEAATQTRLNFLPEHHTDFIFSVVGEQYGFLGASIVLSLYALLIWRILRVLTVAKNLFGALVAAGILAMLLFQVFVNVGMTIGIMPITGVPLPLMSYGGSSVITTLLAIGLLQSIYAQGRASAAVKGRVLAF
jgi:rod shape determining protein RodA